MDGRLRDDGASLPRAFAIRAAARGQLHCAAERRRRRRRAACRRGAIACAARRHAHVRREHETDAPEDVMGEAQRLSEETLSLAEGMLQRLKKARGG